MTRAAACPRFDVQRGRSYNLDMADEALLPAEKLRLALELFDAGVDLMRQNLRRRHPGATEEERGELLIQWLRTRPGAELGDSPGRRRAFAEPST